MKKALLVLFFALVPFLTFAQQNKPAEQPKEVKILKPTIVLGDLVFVSQTLKTVELKGGEVDAYMAVDKHITTILQDMAAKQKKPGDSVQLDFPADIAQNTLVFMNRASLVGQNAVIYKRFVDAMVASAK